MLDISTNFNLGHRRRRLITYLPLPFSEPRAGHDSEGARTLCWSSAWPLPTSSRLPRPLPLQATSERKLTRSKASDRTSISKVGICQRSHDHLSHYDARLPSTSATAPTGAPPLLPPRMQRSRDTRAHIKEAHTINSISSQTGKPQSKHSIAALLLSYGPVYSEQPNPPKTPRKSERAEARKPFQRNAVHHPILPMPAGVFYEPFPLPVGAESGRTLLPFSFPFADRSESHSAAAGSELLSRTQCGKKNTTCTEVVTENVQRRQMGQMWWRDCTTDPVVGSQQSCGVRWRGTRKTADRR